MNTSEKMEGTIVLDGLIEGKVADADVEDKLGKWIEFTASMGLKFNLDAGGAAFSVLPDNHPMSCAKLMPSPDDAIRQAVEQLVKVLPKEDQASVFSTLRSAEFRKNEEIQSLYVVGPGGEVQVQSRTVEAKTTAPPRPVTVKERVKLGLFGLLFAAAMFGVLMLIPPFREKVAEMFTSMTPVQVESVAIKPADALQVYFTATPKEFVQGSRVLVITLKRTDAYPKDETAQNEAFTKADSLSKKLAVQAIARGFVRIEMVDTDGVTFASAEVRIRDLETKESIDVAVPVTAGEKKRKLERVEIRY